VAPDNLRWQFRTQGKQSQDREVPSSTMSEACTDSVTILGIWILLSPSSYYKKKSTATKREHVTVSIPQKLEIIMKLKREESKRSYCFIQH